MIAVFLFDESGIMAQPWAEAGIECYCVDTQHSIRKPRKEGNINYVWGDARWWTPPAPVCFLGAFPECTNVSGSGARDWPIKGGILLRDAIEQFEACRRAGGWSGAPYFIENPVSKFSKLSHIGKPDHYFNPCDYGGYLPPDRRREAAYTKKTCIWAGNGFVMPEKKSIEPVDGSKMWKMGSGNPDRQKERAKTPPGFNIAVFEANYPKILVESEI
ncbi:MAG: hypothetical protein NXI13_16320 [Proteobacteria bacterium]|nr:hypothetical protein [Pseudomonadota bacterium]